MEGDDLPRSEVMLRGALLAAALSGLSAIGPYLRGALAANGGEDVDILNFLLPFEHLQADLYGRGERGVNDKGEKLELSAEQRSLIETLHDEERQHVATLTKAIKELGGEPVAKGNYAFAFREVFVLFRLAAELERSAVGAYNGAIPSIESLALRELAGSIVQVEGRHAATVLIHRTEEPAPEAFEPGLTEYQAISSVEKFTGAF
jgi:rubrerythrin